MLPATDDGNWDRKLYGYGTGFYVLGPIPADVATAELDRRLAAIRELDPAQPVTVAGASVSWRTYDFSWRYGKEGDPGHQGYHGLKRVVTDDFLCLGKPSDGLNETRYVDEISGGRYYLWTGVTVEKPVLASIIVSCDAPADKSHTSAVITPAAVFVNGEAVSDLARPLMLRAGPNPVLARYDHAGRGHFVLRRADVPPPTERQPLAMRWYDDPGVIPFDVWAARGSAEWFRFLSAPGTTAIRGWCRPGKVEAWLGGQPMIPDGVGGFMARIKRRERRSSRLHIVPEIGRSGGEAIREPIVVQTDGSGVMELGTGRGSGFSTTIPEASATARKFR